MKADRKRLLIALEPDLLSELKLLAVKQQLTLTAAIRGMLRENIDRRKREVDAIMKELTGED